jgi:cell division protein FtsW
VLAGVPVMIGVSMLPKDMARRLSIAGAAFFSVLLALVPLVGTEVNGAVRWLGVDPVRFQPSEFLKPFFVVTMAWMLSLRAKDASLPVIPLSGLVVACIAALLMKQPDFGQTVIFCAVWMALLLLSGIAARYILWLAGAGAALLALAFVFYENGRNRVIEFLTGTGDTYHVDVAYATITNGGMVGARAGRRGGEVPPTGGAQRLYLLGDRRGVRADFLRGDRDRLPRHHGARVHQAAGRGRSLHPAGRRRSGDAVRAAGGHQHGMVNVQIAPSKGMTLPFISYGGSSLVAVSIGFGLLLAFMRRNPYLTRSPYVVKWNQR